ncbi:MAG TPA: glycosyltransferase family 39 protein [Devosiaceae bacterium]|nr:glycosyltransferase family 39 protein [Devosiaceae bacterium]
MTDFASPLPATARVKHLGLLQAIAFFFLAVKILYVFRVGPMFDEAYYWMWGQHPGLSYFDHPPLQGWLLGISDALFGRSLFGLRWLTLATLGGIFYIFHLWAKRLAGENWQTLFWPGIVIYLASPTFGYFTSLAFHDYLLLFLCLSSGHFFLNFLLATHAGEKPKHRDLYVAALLLGLAGLTKYNSVFLGLGVFFYILAKPSLRRLLLDPHLYLAAALAIGMQAPVIIWNLANGFSSFEFHLSTRHDDNWLREINWRSFWDFPGASAFLISPFLIPVFWRFFMRRHETRFEEVAKGLAIWVFWLSTGTFILVSLFDWVFWWWNLVAYILVMPFAAKHMGQRVLFYGHVVFGALVTLYMIISTVVLPLSLFHGESPDPRQTRLYGWEELRDGLEAARDRYQPDFIASDGPDLASVAGFALDDPQVTALTDRVTQFYYWFDRQAHVGQDALIVLLKGEGSNFVRSQFESLTPIGEVEIVRFGYFVNGFEFYYGENYQPTSPGRDFSAQ